MCIIDDGSAEDVDGGVVGINRDFDIAGDGDVARYRSKSAPSSPVLFLPGRDGFIIRRGGVLGGLEWNVGC